MRRTSLQMVYELAMQDPRIVFIGSDLGAGALDEFKRDMPERFFMEGVSEANIIGMAAGLAMDGFIPYVNTIATFMTRRCYEQVAVDLCLHNLPVRLISNGGGMVYAPLGPTHIAIEDMAIMRTLPNMTVVAPADADEMKRLMPATVGEPGPVYIRLAKGGDPVVTRDEDGFEIGKAILLREPGDVLFVSTGIMSNRTLTAADALAAEGISAGVLHVHTVKPLDDKAILDLVADVQHVVIAEEHTRIGGLGSAVTDLLTSRLGNRIPAITSIGIPDVFTDKYGSQDDLLELYGLQPAQLAETVRRLMTQSQAA